MARKASKDSSEVVDVSDSEVLYSSIPSSKIYTQLGVSSHVFVDCRSNQVSVWTSSFSHESASWQALASLASCGESVIDSIERGSSGGASDCVETRVEEGLFFDSPIPSLGTGELTIYVKQDEGPGCKASMATRGSVWKKGVRWKWRWISMVSAETLWLEGIV